METAKPDYTVDGKEFTNKRDWNNAMVSSYLTEQGLFKLTTLTETAIDSSTLGSNYNLDELIDSIHFSFFAHKSDETNNILGVLADHLNKPSFITLQVSAEIKGARPSVATRSLVFNDLNSKGLNEIGLYLVEKPNRKESSKRIKDYIKSLNTVKREGN